MSAISNDFSRIRVINLNDDRPERGPFVVSQSGSLPGDPLLAEHDYVLGRRGEWLEWTEILGDQPGVWDEVVFDAVEEFMLVLENLSGPPVVRPASRPAAEMLAELRRVDANGGIREEIRRLLRQHHERKNRR